MLKSFTTHFDYFIHISQVKGYLSRSNSFQLGFFGRSLVSYFKLSLLFDSLFIPFQIYVSKSFRNCTARNNRPTKRTTVPTIEKFQTRVSLSDDQRPIVRNWSSLGLPRIFSTWALKQLKENPLFERRILSSISTPLDYYHWNCKSTWVWR